MIDAVRLTRHAQAIATLADDPHGKCRKHDKANDNFPHIFAPTMVDDSRGTLAYQPDIQPTLSVNEMALLM
ncbi:hypothetical protein [Ideonella paludis]|uniref:Uncharacterized protein n=1 Tax=Ideonella paludis TaxID=1233411 RepID=A0ABS5DWR3_9BURK|nr:hypothetical protein [Ideonella paludis]MBQ0935593.1 hypothetical protein [Ideonella paludis]